jgi:O-antigen/teichoic acid export membrane protein
MKFLSRIKNIFHSDNLRTQKAKKNIFWLYVFNAVNFLTFLLLVPLSLDYLGPVEYGIWITLNSILLWIGYLDFGIGNGLRNKLSESLALNDLVKAKTLVSTAYFIFTAAMLIISLIFIITFGFWNWQKILNTPAGLDQKISLLVFVVFLLFIAYFVLKMIS